MSVPFVWGSGGQQVDQRQIESRRALANALLMRSIDTSPVQHWTQGAARIAQAIAGMRQAQFADEDEKAGKQGLQAAIAQMLGGEAAPTQVASLTSAQTPAAPRVAPDAATDVSAPRPAQPLANVQPMSTGGMQDNMKTAMGEFVQAFPEMQGRITSGYRDQQRNAAVGGASGSRHMQGDAIDFSVAGLPEARQQEIANWWRQRGAGGFGYYPHKGAMHVDFGAQRAWGPNYSRTSLGDTPQWFQSFAAMPANQQAAPVAPQAATPMAEKTLGAMVRNGLANQAAQAQASPPVQVAQAAGAAPQSSPAPAAAPQGGMSQDRLRAAYNVLNSPFAGPADKAIAQTIIQRALTAETRDPRDSRLKDLSIAEKEAALRNNTGDLDRQLKQRQLESGDLTTDQRELAQVNKERAAANLPALRMDQWKIEKSKAGATTVNIGQDGQQYGNPGDGLVWQRDPTGKVVIDERGAPVAIPFRGGKMFNEEQKRAETKAEQGKQKLTQADMIMQDIDRTLGLMDNATLPTTGAIGSLLTNVPSTAAADMARLTDGIKANIGFDKLAEMRAASPTGAALGSVTEKELAFLQSVVGSLEQSQSAPQYRYNLLRLKNAYLDTVHGPGQGPPREKLPEVPTRREAQQPAQQQAPAAPQPGKVLRYNPQTGALE